MQRRYFYILSFPRCRSTWFSQFFSTNISRCFHEALSGNDSSAFYTQMKAWPGEQIYVGSADTNPISLGRTPRITGPMVMVLRPEEDVIRSLLKTFDPHPKFSKKEWRKYIRNMVDMYSIALEWYREHEPNLMVVDFKDLEDEQVIMRVWNHCIPDPRWIPDWNYIKNMNGLRITVKRRQGLARGIDQTCKNLAKGIERFKTDHLDRYNRDKFRRDFWKEPDPKEEPLRLYYGAGTRAALGEARL